MRRWSAISLLVAICFSTIVAPVFADEANLPECCRRNGAHRCSMGSMDSMSASDAGSTGAALQSPKCPECPTSSSTMTSPDFAFLKSSIAIFAALVSHPSLHFQTEAQYRISFSRVRQKRGPPSLS